MATIPSVQVIQFNKDIDPSGARNVPASGIKSLGVGANDFLDFGDLNVSVSGLVSDTKLVVFSAIDLGTASGIDNMRFFLKSISAWDVGTFRFLFRISTEFLGAGFELTTSDSDVSVGTISSQNLFATDGSAAISGITDDDVSQYIYLADFVSTDVPFGTRRGTGGTGYTYRILFDFS